MKRIDKFVRRLYKHQPEDHESMEALKQMLYEKVDDLMREEDLSEEDAINRTIEEFGDEKDYELPALEKEKRRHRRAKTLRHYKNDLLFSALATLLIASIVFITNYALLDQFFPWIAIIITLGVLFWPLSILYKYLNKKGDHS